MNLIELSNWGWVILLFILILIVWLLVLFQARQSIQEVQSIMRTDHELEETTHGSDHTESHEREEG